VKPLFPFYGSKYNLARRYPPPAHERVIEPFAGSAGYSTFYEPGRVDLFDADPIIAGLWDYLLSVSAEEILNLPELPAVGDSVENYALPQEAKWLIGFWLNRGSATPKKTRTAYSARTDRAQLNWSRRAKERIASSLPKLAGWTITNASYEAGPDIEATRFIDPPYQDKGRYYRFPLADFDRLSRWCRDQRGLTIVCEGPGATWLPFTDLGSFKSTKGRATEVVWINGDGSRLL
jgi:site-specific DNA-adenine methylase